MGLGFEPGSFHPSRHLWRTALSFRRSRAHLARRPRRRSLLGAPGVRSYCARLGACGPEGAPQRGLRPRARAALNRAAGDPAAGDPAVQPWHLAPLLRTISVAYEQAGPMELAARAMTLASEVAQTAPDKHEDLLCWFAAEAALKLRRIGAFGAARVHMDLALHGLVSFLERADPQARVPAIETLLDDVRRAIHEGNEDGARASLALATFLANLYRIDLSDLDEDATELLELLESRNARGAAVRITQSVQASWLRGARSTRQFLPRGDHKWLSTSGLGNCSVSRSASPC